MEVTYFNLSPNGPPSTVKVLSVCTNSGPGLDNFIASVTKFGYNYEILCHGDKWEGWKWRTSKYIEHLEKEDDGLFVLCDTNDVLFLRPPQYLIDSFLSYKCPILIGGEQGCWNDRLKKHPLERKAILRAYDRLSSARYRYPNGGFLIGYRQALLHVLNCNKEYEDDQMGYTLLWSQYPELFEIDSDTRCVGNIVATIPFFDSRVPEINERSLWRIVLSSKSYQKGEVIATNIITEFSPAVLHFPGGNVDDYNEIGKLLLESRFVSIPLKNRIKYTLKKPWVSSMAWILGGNHNQ